MSTDPSTTESKLKFARDKKAIGDEAFKAGNMSDGSCSYLIHIGVPLINRIAV